MTAPFAGPDSRAVEIATAFWERMGNLPDPGWRVFAGPPHKAPSDHLFLSDHEGTPLDRSGHLGAALRRDTGWIHVGLSDRSGQIFSQGRVGRRRSFARTVGAAMQVVGPLAVVASHSSPDPASGGSEVARPQAIVADITGSAWFAHRLGRAAVTYREWACARIAAPDATTRRLRVTSAWQTGDSRFWADPCVVVHADRVWLFMEELDRTTGRGRIVVAEFRDGHLRDPRIVLANEHHLSFPQVMWRDGRWLATVETCSAHNPVYEFDEIGAPWRPYAGLPALPAHTADPVLDLDRGILMGSDALTDGDSVLVSYRLDGSGWQPVPEYTRVDVAWSRGGGTWDRDRAVRTVQDCAGTYGLRIGWTDATDPDGHLASWGAPDLSDSTDTRSGIHTMTWDSDQQHVWIDGWRRRFSLLGWRTRLVEISHLRRCQG